MGPSRWFVLSILIVSLSGCSRGAVKGPVGQGDQGLGLKIPVLDLFKRKTYDPDNFTPDNIDEDEVNPFREDNEEIAPPADSFTRYREDRDW